MRNRILLVFLVLCTWLECWSYTVKEALHDDEIERHIQNEKRRCVDKKWASCGYYKKNGLCHLHKRSLYQRCRKTCSLCGDARCVLSQYGCCWDLRTAKKGPNGEGCPRNCRNVIGRKRCLFLKKNSACVTDKARMARLCRGVCVCENYEIQFSPPKCMMSLFGCCWDSKTEAKGPNQFGCPVCRDRWPRTVCKVFSKDCKARLRKRGAQMRSYCPERCGLCPKKSTQNDSDE